MQAERYREWPPLADGEHPIEPSDELLWRQVNPRFFQGGIIGDLAFRAREEEQFQLSASRSSKVTAQEAYDHHTCVAGRESVGVAAVSALEIEQAGSRAIDDCDVQVADPPTPGHAYIDCRIMTKTERRDFREECAAVATDRGLVYPPVREGSTPTAAW